ncbi:MAG: hypothetical protein AAGI92_00795 [Pseudomonadota bacterium]
MAEPKDMIVPMLREMRAENSEFREEMKESVADIKERLDALEGRQKSYSHALTADTMMSKFMLGD